MHLKYWSSLLILLISCTQKEQEQKSDQEDLNPTIANIIEAHGGLDQWENQHTLSYELGNQSHTIDLKSREVKITTSEFSMGNDDGTVWIKDPNENYEGSPTFYHSLMFYFYAMPFVFADDGIIYESMPEKEIKGKTYGAMKISYEEGVGDSPEDEYIVYYDPQSHKMEWLAYTVTFQSQEESDDFHLIHYQKWDTFNGLQLPVELQWYEYENNEAGEPQGEPRTFTNIKVTEEDMDDEFYAMPEGAKVDSASVN
ncbi:MAG: DUF6503 family protein [Balneolaceae bacterium]|nr:DUF6503 family protein [Balneolaceae bacterium]